MKQIISLLLILTLFNCSSVKTIKTDIETQNWINNQNFTIVKPNNWRPIKHHDYVGYTPLKKGENHFNNLVSIFQYQLKEKPSTLSELFSLIQKKETNTPLEIRLVKNSQLGDIYTVITESNWNGQNYKRYSVYFEHNKEYYNYNYSSLKNIYDINLKEAMAILQSIKFKK
ncbi:hypothetical protein KUL156_61270 [Alteromonas sp. KUL156]|nr:hypothetical protein KUL154_10730 [Alteromonas sp. KUL154]GFE03535.1 hypothetical protein KUL156_61270 [Alteromonas sp. KUL156]